jgi:hypothetical protein
MCFGDAHQVESVETRVQAQRHCFKIVQKTLCIINMSNLHSQQTIAGVGLKFDLTSMGMTDSTWCSTLFQLSPKKEVFEMLNRQIGF